MAVHEAGLRLHELKETFKAGHTSDTKCLEKCRQLLSQLKVDMLSLSFMPAEDSEASVAESLLCREILEIGVRWSVAVKDTKSFERYFSQLLTYYTDFESVLPVSPYKCEILGLNLLHLLCQSRIAEFHMFLEMIPSKDMMADVYILHAIQLERFIMEGSYNKIIIGRDNVPSPGYVFFIETLIDTIREEIGGCIEHAFESIRARDLQKLLFLENASKVDKFANERGWMSKDAQFVFPTTADTAPKVLKKDLISNSIFYAEELERIV